MAGAISASDTTGAAPRSARAAFSALRNFFYACPFRKVEKPRIPFECMAPFFTRAFFEMFADVY
ncbi:MAG: hypothetical protein DBX55_02380 [Verrucomicrobia bacterium]|nr:MAG: hypothetical protein DBX55_02380 [Verrucomicrobiota bacterium]